MLPDINTVVPLVQASSFAFIDPVAYSNGVKRDLIPLALTNPGLLDGILVSSCRSLHVLYDGKGSYLERALRYKLACIRSLNQEIMVESTMLQDATILKSIVMAGDEVSLSTNAWPCVWCK
jgi:hypothetical protein